MAWPTEHHDAVTATSTKGVGANSSYVGTSYVKGHFDKDNVG